MAPPTASRAPYTSTDAMVSAMMSSTSGRIVRQIEFECMTRTESPTLWRSKLARWRSSCPKARTTARPESPSAMYVVTCAKASLAFRHAGLGDALEGGRHDDDEREHKGRDQCHPPVEDEEDDDRANQQEDV